MNILQILHIVLIINYNLILFIKIIKQNSTYLFQSSKNQHYFEKKLKKISTLINTLTNILIHKLFLKFLIKNNSQIIYISSFYIFLIIVYIYFYYIATNI